ncbi:MAG: NADH-quinone oxidoreductase subunit E, partial [Pseudomonadota bacterium]
GKDYYEDLTIDSLASLIDRMAAGEVPKPGPQNGRWASEPVTGLTSLKGDPAHTANASIDIAGQLGDSIKRIDGSDPLPTWGGDTPSTAVPHTESSITTPSVAEEEEEAAQPVTPPKPSEAFSDAPTDQDRPADFVADDGVSGASAALRAETDADKPELLAVARDGGPDDLKKIKGVGPKLEGILHDMGIFHFDQIASWSPTEVEWVDDRLKFKGRIERDGWIDQAKTLASGGETEFSKRKSK